MQQAWLRWRRGSRVVKRSSYSSPRDDLSRLKGPMDRSGISPAAGSEEARYRRAIVPAGSCRDEDGIGREGIFLPRADLLCRSTHNRKPGRYSGAGEGAQSGICFAGFPFAASGHRRRSLLHVLRQRGVFQHPGHAGLVCLDGKRSSGKRDGCNNDKQRAKHGQRIEPRRPFVH